MVRRFLVLGLMSFVVSAFGGNVVVDNGGAGGSGQGGSGAGNGGSGGNVCTKAAKFVQSCAGSSTGSTIPPGGCTGATECASQCILNSSCAVIEGSDPAGAAVLAQCIMACTGG